MKKHAKFDVLPLPAGWCVYMLVCADNSFYIGLTEHLATRIRDHASSKGGGYTKSVKPTQFVWYEPHFNRESAAARERQLKAWSRDKKRKLAQGIPPFTFGHPIRASVLSC